jgi:hypothetical protein
MSKKIAITSIFINITCDDKNHRSIETTCLKRIFEKNGKNSVDIIGKKNRNNNTLDFYKDFRNTDFSEYDMVVLQLTSPNFFGGVLNDYTEKICDDLANFKGTICIPVNDPRILFKNPAEIIAKRFDKCTNSIKQWDNIIENAVYLCPGKNIEKMMGYVPKKYKNIDWFKEIFKFKYDNDYIKASTHNYNKKYDVVYYGDKRGAFREKQLLKYFPDNTHNLLIGYKSNKINADFIKKVNHDVLIDTLNDCKVSLVVGDKEHLDNIVTNRFYETLASDCLAAIQIEYDPGKTLICDPVLRDILYVESKEDVEKLVNLYSPELIDRQKKELIRIFNS